MQIKLRRREEEYELSDFKREEFPIKIQDYSKEDFLKGIERIRIFYNDSKPFKIYLLGSVSYQGGSISSNLYIESPSDIEKILEFIENKEQEQAAEASLEKNIQDKLAN